LPRKLGHNRQMESSLKLLRTVWAAMLGSIALYVLVAERFAPPPKETTPGFFYAITVMAVAMIGAIFVTRRVLVARSENVLATNPEDSFALNRWRLGYLISFGLSEAVALYGLALRFAGSYFSQVVPFFLAGFILMLFFGPRRPCNAIG